jgi:hypothetical protein
MEIALPVSGCFGKSGGNGKRPSSRAKIEAPRIHRFSRAVFYRRAGFLVADESRSPVRVLSPYFKATVMRGQRVV